MIVENTGCMILKTLVESTIFLGHLKSAVLNDSDENQQQLARHTTKLWRLGRKSDFERLLRRARGAASLMWWRSRPGPRSRCGYCSPSGISRLILLAHVRYIKELVADVSW